MIRFRVMGRIMRGREEGPFRSWTFARGGIVKDATGITNIRKTRRKKIPPPYYPSLSSIPPSHIEKPLSQDAYPS